MKNIFFLLAMLLSLQVNAQTTIIGGSGICIVNGDPDDNDSLQTQDSRFECMVAFDTSNQLVYTYDMTALSGVRWNPLSTGGSDTRVDSAFILNDTLNLVVRLIDDLSVVKTMKVAVPGTNLTFTGTTSPITLNSSTGSDVSFKDSTGIYLRRVGSTITIFNTGDTNAADDLTGSGAANQFALLTGANTFTGNAAFSYRLLYRALELNGSSTSGNHRTRLIFSGADTVFNAANAGFSNISANNSIRTSNTGQLISFVNIGGFSGFGNTIFVDHNNANIRPFSVEPPTVTIAGGVTGTAMANVARINGGSGWFSALNVNANSASNAIIADGGSAGVAIGLRASGSTSQILYDVIHTPSANGNCKSAMRFSSLRAGAATNGMGIDFHLQSSGSGAGAKSNYFSHEVITSDNATFTSSFIFENHTNGTRSEHLRIGANGIGVNLGAQPVATIQVKGSGTTSSSYGLIVTNSGGVTTTASLAVRDDGNVGIGTNAPERRLHTTGELLIGSTALSGDFIIFDDSNGSGEPELRLNNSGIANGLITVRTLPTGLGNGFYFNAPIESAARIGTLNEMVSVGLNSVGSGVAFTQSTPGGAMRLRPANGSSAYVNFLENGGGFSGSLGFSSGSNSLKYRAGASTFADGTIVFSITNTGSAMFGGTTDATSRVHIDGANGYQQLRLVDSYTPTATGDTNGAQGDVAWDDDYIYIKTSAGWKRSALSTF